MAAGISLIPGKTGAHKAPLRLGSGAFKSFSAACYVEKLLPPRLEL
jgi:hypothetical protein